MMFTPTTNTPAVSSPFSAPPPSRSLPSHPPPSHPPPSLPHPLSHPPLSQLQSHPPQSHAPLSRPTHPPPGYRPPPQGPPGTAKPAGGATGGAAGGAGGRLPGGVIGVGVSAAAGGALMSEARLMAGDSGQGGGGSHAGGLGMPAPLSSRRIAYVILFLCIVVVTNPRQGSWRAIVDKVVEGYKLAGWLILTLPSVFSMLQQPAAGLMEGIVDKRQGSWRAIVDKVVEGYKLAGLAQQLALRGYHVLALMKLRMYGAAAEELTLHWLAAEPAHAPIPAPCSHPCSLLPSLLPAPIPAPCSHPCSLLPSLLPAPIPAPCSHPSPHCLPTFPFQAPCCPLRCAGWQQSCLTAWATRPSHWSDHAPCRHTAQLSNPTAWAIQLSEATMRSAGILHSTAKCLLRYEPSNAALLSRYGLVRLQLGDVEGASAAFGLVKTMVVHREVEMESEGGSGGGGGEGAGEGEGGGEATGDASNTAGAGAGGAGAGATGAGGGSEGGVGAGRVTAANVGEMKRLVRLNKALVHFARKEHGQALQLFTAVTKEDPTNSVAPNITVRQCGNPVTWRESQGFSHFRRHFAREDPTTLAASDTLNAKSTLSNWLTRLAPDDFDFACTRLWRTFKASQTHKARSNWLTRLAPDDLDFA
ncbi:unnamed protein product [Closterium sp. Naga37s-1]|nr:unnamed protein product [Closterium sp. Naga37s-1]